MCELTYDHNTSGPRHPESKALASGNGEAQVLWTEPNFGCVQFKRVEPPLADHFYVPRPEPPNPQLFGCSVVPTCYACGDRGARHPLRPRQEHAYVEGKILVPDWEYWGTLGCSTCDRPRWEHPIDMETVWA